MNNLALEIGEKVLVQNKHMLDKRQVERQFERAAESYNLAAELQQSIIQELLGQTENQQIKTERIIDLGCGTGLGLVELAQRFPDAQLTGVDISQAMLGLASLACPQAKLLKADIEDLPYEDLSFDLVFTTSTLQWCDLSAALDESARILKPGGAIALATFGPKTHIEWKSAWERVDGFAHTIEFPDQAALASRIQQCGLKPLKHWSEMQRLVFEDTQAVLRSVKNLGATNANTGRQRGLMGKQRFQQFLQEFEKLSPDHGLSYEVFFAIAQKPH